MVNQKFPLKSIHIRYSAVTMAVMSNLQYSQYEHDFEALKMRGASSDVRHHAAKILLDYCPVLTRIKSCFPK